MPLAASELILNNQGKVYHLNVGADDIADTVILVGDPARVEQVSSRFSKIRFKTAHREFITHTGTFNNKDITVISTGIGPDNIDIVINELDAAVNIHPYTRQVNPSPRKLRLIRLGTCGALQQEVHINDLICSAHAIGLDNVLRYYQDQAGIRNNDLETSFIQHTNWPSEFAPYAVSTRSSLLQNFAEIAHQGITLTAPGFYGPQGRSLRLRSSMPELNEMLTTFHFNGTKVLNFEMETSAIYGLGQLLGHECLTICVAIANRIRKEFSNDLIKSTNQLIDECLNRI